ncbi:hypothetical protein K6119_08040 [Paracrocinitomix mangrovi]|uniref:toxin-antitoxin system YwqK family antitoxin n=1 Tax=Paracrocinitomix mangrovi TaxID=2862509 RepID=UPI001C8ED73E|nr:hypothetical protein [Paracrocinitomix mangrovi]UKN03462.1 hypothetical protein K6119_08040 [Paracrocinitomix mangrovi]
MKYVIVFIFLSFQLGTFCQLDTIWTLKNSKHHIGRIYSDSTLYQSFDLNYEEYSYFSPDSSKQIIIYETPSIHNDSIVEGVGTLSGDDYFRNGTVKTYYPNGNLKEIINYKSGLLNGKYELYYKSGNLAVTGQYLKHARIGKWKYFYNNQTVISQKEYNGTMTVCWVYPPTLESIYFSEGYTLIHSDEKIQTFKDTYCPGGYCSLTWINL